MAEYTAENGWPGHATRLAAVVFRYLDVGGTTPSLTIHSHARAAARDTGDLAAEADATNDRDSWTSF